MTSPSNSSSEAVGLHTPGPVEAGFLLAGLRPRLTTEGGETVARLRVRDDVYEGASILGREAALRDLGTELPDSVARRAGLIA